jgi:acyl-CoA oxidase
MHRPDFTDHLRPAVPGAPVLERERAKSTLPVEDVARIIFGDAYLARQERILKLLESNKWFNKTTQLNLSRPDRFKLILMRAKLLRRMSLEYGWDEEDEKMAM